MRVHLSARHSAGLACLVGVLLSTGGPALAHEDSASALTARAGPYQVLAYDGVPGSVADEVDYAVLVQDAEGRPVDGADVTVTATSTAAATRPVLAVGPISAQAVANVYRFSLPDPGPAAWSVDVAVNSGAGPGSTTVELHAAPRPIDAVAVLEGARRPAPASVSPLPVIAIIGGAVVVVAVLALSAGQRTREASPARTDEHV